MDTLWDTLLTVALIGALLIAVIGGTFGGIYAVDRLVQSSPDELARQWTEDWGAERIARDTAAWMARTKPEATGVDDNWLRVEINSIARWDIPTARRVREGVYETVATARIHMTLPNRSGVTAEVVVPWNLRIQPANQGIRANSLRKKHGNVSILAQAVAATTPVGAGVPEDVTGRGHSTVAGPHRWKSPEKRENWNDHQGGPRDPPGPQCV